MSQTVWLSMPQKVYAVDELGKFGLKVSSLYISQVKRKYGLEVEPNYNPPKSEDQKVQQCLPEKEKAVMAALEYFQMI